MSNQNQTQIRDDNILFRIRHSASHILAQVVLELFPEAKLGTGLAIADGFYYDFDLPRNLTPEDLAVIESRMRDIISSNSAFVHDELFLDEAREKFKIQPYKLELIDAIARGELGTHGETDAKPSDTVSVYTQNGFLDLCAGPHVEHTGQVPLDGFKFLSIAGAYWGGDENRPQLQRIYGTAWGTHKELEDHLQILEEAKQHDHRKLGRELEIFIFEEEVGPGLPLWLPNGGILIEELENLAKEMENKGDYVRVRSPHITKEALFERSGHLPYYAESMYPPMENGGRTILSEADELSFPSQDLCVQVPQLP